MGKPMGALWARKAIRKTATCLFCKAGLFICRKGMKIKITVKFRASRRLHFEDTKRIMSPKMLLKSFGTFEKRAPGPLTGFGPRPLGWPCSVMLVELFMPSFRH